MELYERVRYMAEKMVLSHASLARLLNMQVRTFQGYLNAERQDNLWPLLPKILKEFPRLSRQWLYFGEGPMTIGLGIPLDQPVPLRVIAHAVEEMARATDGTERSLLLMLAQRAVAADSDMQERNSHDVGEVAALRAEVTALTKDLLSAQKEVIRLQAQLLSVPDNSDFPCPSKAVAAGTGAVSGACGDGKS